MSRKSAEKRLATARRHLDTLSRAIAQIPEAKKTGENCYRIGSLTVSCVISGASVVLYFLTTEGAAWYVTASGVGANFIINLLSGKVSIDHFREILSAKDKSAGLKIVEIVAKLLVAGVVAIPQTMIAAIKANGEALKVFAGTISALGYTALNSMAVKRLLDLHPDLKFSFLRLKCCKSSEEEEQVKFISKLEESLEKLKRRDISSLPFSSGGSTQQAIIEKIFAITDGVGQARCFTHRFWESGGGKFVSGALTFGKVLIKAVIATLLVYGTTGYACDTALTISNYMPAILAFVLGNLAMSCTYILNVSAGIFIHSWLGSVINFLKYLTVENETKMGGKLGLAFSAISPLLAAFIGSFSGETAMRLFNEGCLAPTSVFPNFLRFSFSGALVNWSTKVFNSIFVYVAFMAMKSGLVGLKGSDQEKYYLLMETTLKELIDNVKQMSPEECAEFKIQMGRTTSSSEHAALLSAPGQQAASASASP